MIRFIFSLVRFFNELDSIIEMGGRNKKQGHIHNSIIHIWAGKGSKIV